MFQFIIDLLTNPWMLMILLTPLFLLVGVILGHYVSQPRKHRVLKVNPESHQALELDVDGEDAVNIYCKPVGNIPNQRFIKQLNPYNVVKKGWLRLQNYAMWFGRYGTAYVHDLINEAIPVSFKQAVYNVFGEQYYNQIPRDVKHQIEEGKLGVMIKFPNLPLTPMDKDGKLLPSISEDDIKRDKDDKAMDNLWSSFEREKKSSAINMIAYIGCGIAIGIVLCLIFQWGAPVVIENVVPSG